VRTENEAVHIGLYVAGQADGLQRAGYRHHAEDDDGAHDPVDKQTALRRFVDEVIRVPRIPWVIFLLLVLLFPPLEGVVLFPDVGPRQDVSLANGLLDCTWQLVSNTSLKQKQLRNWSLRIRHTSGKGVDDRVETPYG